MWERTDCMATVEDCHRLDIWDLIRGNLLFAGQSGTLRWLHGVSSKVLGSAGFYVRLSPLGQLELKLSFRYGQATEIVQFVPISFNRNADGRISRLFTCPLDWNGSVCGLHVRKLYAKGPYFGCRRCHSLTYESCQEAHKFERLRERLQRRYD